MEILFESFAGNLPSLIVIGVFMLATTLINNGYLSKTLNGRGKGKTKPIAECIEEVKGKINGVKDEVEKLSRRVGYVEKSALMGNIHNKELHTIERLRAFDCYLRLGCNGLVADYALKELILSNREDWIRTQQENTMEISCDKYEARIAEINKAIKERI